MKDNETASVLGQLNATQWHLVRDSWLVVLAFVIVSVTAYSCVDFYLWESDVAYAWVALIVWALDYLLLLSLMEKGGYFRDGKASGIGTYVALGVVTGMAVSLAFVVLVLPGLYLLMRWLPVYSRALTTSEWIRQSLRWSWHATAPFQRPLALALVGPVVLSATSMAASYAYGRVDWVLYEPAMLVANLAANLATVWFAALGIATFGLVRDTSPTINQPA